MHANYLMTTRYFTIMEPRVLSKALKNSADVTSDEHQATQARLDTVLYLAIDAARVSGKVLVLCLLSHAYLILTV